MLITQSKYILYHHGRSSCCWHNWRKTPTFSDPSTRWQPYKHKFCLVFHSLRFPPALSTVQHPVINIRCNMYTFHTFYTCVYMDTFYLELPKNQNIFHVHIIEEVTDFIGKIIMNYNRSSLNKMYWRSFLSII